MSDEMANFTIKALSLAQRRDLERAKYEHLQRTSAQYGASYHGKDAIALIELHRPRLVIDLGCGRNQLARDLRRLGIDALGVDWVYAEADVRRPMHRTGLVSGAADMITAFDSLEHLLIEDVPRTLAECRRLARPGGRFVFSISTRPSRITVAGQNLHPTVRPLSWWVTQINKVGVVEQQRANHKYITGRFKGS